MRRALLVIFIPLAIASVLWSAVALSVHGRRLEHRDVVQSVNAGEAVSTVSLDAAVRDYEQLARLVPCYPAFREELAELQAASVEVSGGDVSGSAAEKAGSTLADHLACSPLDGNAWLNYAMIAVQQEGFNAKALQAYKRSASVAPREGWIAEKRLLFALQFYPVFDEEALLLAQRDIVVIQAASGSRRRHVLRASGMDSLEALQRHFATAREEAQYSIR